MMEDQQTLTSPDGSSNGNPPERCPRPLYSRDSTQEDQEIPLENPIEDLQDVKIFVIKEEEEEDEISVMEFSEGSKDVMLKHSNDRNTPERCPHPLYSRDSTQEDQEIPHHHQGKEPNNMKDDVDDGSVRGDHQSTEKYRMTVAMKEEESSLDIDGHKVTTLERPPILPLDYNVEDNDIAEYCPEENPDPPTIHHRASYVQRSMAPSTPEDISHNSHPVNNEIHQRLYIENRSLDLSDPHRSSSAPLDTSPYKGNKVILCSGNQRTNLGERPYLCSECGKSFNWKGHLLRHLRSHTDERPFECLQCKKNFKHRADLHRHQGTHTGERPFSCAECGKCFTQKGSLLTHQKSHSGESSFFCQECGKGFTWKRALRIHQRSHTGERPFSCLDCGKSFTQKSNLLTHQRTHTGERPFSCPRCGKCFTRKSRLTAHQKTHTD